MALIPFADAGAAFSSALQLAVVQHPLPPPLRLRGLLFREQRPLAAAAGGGGGARAAAAPPKLDETLAAFRRSFCFPLDGDARGTAAAVVGGGGRSAAEKEEEKKEATQIVFHGSPLCNWREAAWPHPPPVAALQRQQDRSPPPHHCPQYANREDGDGNEARGRLVRAAII